MTLKPSLQGRLDLRSLLSLEGDTSPQSPVLSHRMAQSEPQSASHKQSWLESRQSVDKKFWVRAWFQCDQCGKLIRVAT